MLNVRLLSVESKLQGFSGGLVQVVVVGFGRSAQEIAVNASLVAAKLTLVARRSLWMLPTKPGGMCIATRGCGLKLLLFFENTAYGNGLFVS